MLFYLSSVLWACCFPCVTLLKASQPCYIPCLTLLAEKDEISNLCRVYESSYFITCCHLLFTSHTSLDWQTFITLPMFSLSAAYLFFKVSTFAMREISLPSLSAANCSRLGQEREAVGLSWTCTLRHLHTCWQSGQKWGTITVIRDISPDSCYPNLCTRLVTAYHPEPFRHTSQDRWMEYMEAERERLTLDA